MNELTIFKNEQFGEIRTVSVNNEPWFVGKDVAEVLGYSNTRDAISKHVYDEDKADVAIYDGSQNRNMVAVNESGLYSLILSSKLPTAKEFKRWVTSEVLPSIRRHGAYLTDDMVEQVLTDPDTIIRLAQQIKEAKTQLAAAEHQIQTLEPKAAYFDAVAESVGSTNFRETAKLFGVKEKEFIKFIIDQKLCYRNSRGKIVPYAEYNGRCFEMGEVIYSGSTGQHTAIYTKITPYGRTRIFQRMQKAGMVNAEA